MVQVGLLCFKHFLSLVLKVQTKAVLHFGWFPRISPVKDSVQSLAGTCGPQHWMSVSFHPLLSPHSLYLCYSHWRLTDGSWAFLAVWTLTKCPFLLLLNLPPQYHLPFFPQMHRPRPLDSKSWQHAIFYSHFDCGLEGQGLTSYFYSKPLRKN